MPRTKDRSDDEILKLAMPVVRGKGPDGFTFKELSIATGISPATLIQRFGNKEDLLKRLVQCDLLIMNQQLEEIKQKSSKINKGSSEDPITTIIKIFEEMGQFIKEPKDVHDGLNALKLDILDPQFNELSCLYFSSIKNQLCELIKQAQKNQIISTKFRPSELAELLLDLFQGHAILWAIKPHSTFLKSLKQKIKAILR